MVNINTAYLKFICKCMAYYFPQYLKKNSEGLQMALKKLLEVSRRKGCESMLFSVCLLNDLMEVTGERNLE